MGIGVTVDPERCHPDGSRIPVDQDGWISNTILSLRPSSPFPHIHNHLHRFPGLSSIGASAKSYINIPLQIIRIIPADIINGEQCATIGGGHARNPVGDRKSTRLNSSHVSSSYA